MHLADDISKATGGSPQSSITIIALPHIFAQPSEAVETRFEQLDVLFSGVGHTTMPGSQQTVSGTANSDSDGVLLQPLH